jgi:hypothetical protein
MEWVARRRLLSICSPTLLQFFVGQKEKNTQVLSLSLSLPSATVLMSGSICISLAPAERHVCTGFFRGLTRLQHLSNPRLTHPGLLPQS